MAKTKPTWIEKRDAPKVPEVKVCDVDFADIHAGERMLISTPADIDRYIRQIPAGKFVELLTMRRDLALEAGAHQTCPLTTGIFLRIVAEAAFQEHENGKKRVTPVWRVISPKMPLFKKLTFDTSWITDHQKSEGLEFTTRPLKPKA